MGAFRAGLAVVAVTVALTLAGCATADKTSSGADPLDCDDLASPALVAAAMTGADGVTPKPEPALDPIDFDTSALFLAAAGGHVCSWRVGEPTFASEMDTAYLSIEVLPDAGDIRSWTYSIEPFSGSKTVGSVDAHAECHHQPGGCVIAAEVNGVWAQVLIHWWPWYGDDRFTGLEDGVMLDRLAAVAEPIFEALAGASEDQLSWPHASSEEDASCTGIGKTSESSTDDPVAPRRIGAAAFDKLGTVSCDAEDGATVLIVPGSAASVQSVLKQADFDILARPPAEDVGAPAVSPIGIAAGASTLAVFIDGDTYLVDAKYPEDLARKIGAARGGGSPASAIQAIAGYSGDRGLFRQISAVRA